MRLRHSGGSAQKPIILYVSVAILLGKLLGRPIRHQTYNIAHNIGDEADVFPLCAAVWQRARVSAWQQERDPGWPQSLWATEDSIARRRCHGTVFAARAAASEGPPKEQKEAPEIFPICTCDSTGGAAACG
ncbi:hypothetical protein NDU88_007928 [Pleurodeles waltl]|uniref:Uncharacterized protein n=1 Tax=Pleurodeles waltl TaxID=8319 RepID=A0AAV7U558_PLEWA|nr:hypothetical protein NDU88_007928 [Pleurodeles waltl]